MEALRSGLFLLRVWRVDVLGMLESVLRDVGLSAIEDERERLRADWERFGRTRAIAVAKHQAEVQAQAQVKAKT